MEAEGTRSHVYVVGAGIAGMVAALRLLQHGYRVTVFEASTEIGGKFGAERDRFRIYHEHAYHIFPDWCVNFFALCKEIGLTKEEHFVPCPEFYVLRRPDAAGAPGGSPKGRRREDFLTLRHLGSPEFFWTNVNSGVADWHDMFLFGYSYLDLLTDQSLEREEFLNRVSVNGYVRSLGYASDMTALLHQDMLLKVFASPSYEVSARTYQTYLEFTAGAPFPSPPFYALKGNCQLLFWKPFSDALHKHPGSYRLEPQRELCRIEVKDSRVRRLHFEDYLREPHAVEVGPADQVIVAVPPERLYEVARQSPELLHALPRLRDLNHLQGVRFAALDLFVKTPLELPAGHVTLMDDPRSLLVPDSQEAKNGIASEYGLSFIDNGRFWPAEHWGKGKDPHHGHAARVARAKGTPSSTQPNAAFGLVSQVLDR